MPSSYTASARFVLQATGEGSNVWGGILNNGAFSLIDFNVNGSVTSATATKTLTTANGAADEARAAILRYTGATPGTWTIPSVSKVYQVSTSTAALTLTNGSSSVALIAGEACTVKTDGTTIWKVLPLDYGATIPRSSGTPSIPSHLINKAYADALAFNEVNLPAQTGNAGKVVSTDGADASWQYAIPEPTRITGNTTAVSRRRYECDTIAVGAFTLTLPASPSEGDWVWFWDGGVTSSARGFQTNNLTIARNGSTINGEALNVTVRSAGAGGWFEYENGTWRAHL